MDARYEIIEIPLSEPIYIFPNFNFFSSGIRRLGRAHIAISNKYVAKLVLRYQDGGKFLDMVGVDLANSDFLIISVYLTPGYRKITVEELTSVLEFIQQLFPNKKILVAGDFNPDSTVQGK